MIQSLNKNIQRQKNVCENDLQIQNDDLSVMFEQYWGAVRFGHMYLIMWFTYLFRESLALALN